VMPHLHSERVGKTGAEGLRMKEGREINLSLLTLGNVINKLSEAVVAHGGGYIDWGHTPLLLLLMQPALPAERSTRFNSIALISCTLISCAFNHPCCLSPFAAHTAAQAATYRTVTRSSRASCSPRWAATQRP
jgi:uncharacterized membrane protein